VRLVDEAIETALEMSPRYQRHLHLPDKVIGWLDTAAVRAEIDRRWEVTSDDIVEVISHAAQIPKDMVFRDVGDRFKEIEQRSANVSSARRSRRGDCQSTGAEQRSAEGRFRSSGWCSAVPRSDRRRQDRTRQSGAEFLFGDDKKMIRIDMSEYQDGGVSVDKLIGMPRGIVGSERGGLLTNQLKDNPCSVVLFDEIEKASPSLLNLFLQAFDEGWLTDGAASACICPTPSSS
jgi:ATP-dependent Clp protease ATP-binding subunit ClpA